MTQGKNMKLRYQLQIYDIQKKQWKNLSKYCGMKSIATFLEIPSHTAYRIYNNKSKKYCKLYKIINI